MTNDAFIEEINSAYRRLSAATEDLVRADRELAVAAKKEATSPSAPSSP